MFVLKMHIFSLVFIVVKHQKKYAFVGDRNVERIIRYILHFFFLTSHSIVCPGHHHVAVAVIFVGVVVVISSLLPNNQSHCCRTVYRGKQFTALKFFLRSR